ncbi:UNVERIFIED_ORG: hypothetical protein J2X79_001473 [Arthrobacter globiformis]|nr:hypothetical protein [Arthrobacter globiformis]
MGARLFATQASGGPIDMKCRGLHQRPLKRSHYLNVDGLACRLRAGIYRRVSNVVHLGCYGYSPTRAPQVSARSTRRKGRRPRSRFACALPLPKMRQQLYLHCFHVKRCSSDAKHRWDGSMWFHVKHTFHLLPDSARPACRVASGGGPAGRARFAPSERPLPVRPQPRQSPGCTVEHAPSARRDGRSLPFRCRDMRGRTDRDVRNGSGGRIKHVGLDGEICPLRGNRRRLDAVRTEAGRARGRKSNSASRYG